MKNRVEIYNTFDNIISDIEKIKNYCSNPKKYKHKISLLDVLNR